MRKIFLLLIVATFVICSNAQAAQRPKVIALKPVGIAELNDNDLTIKEVFPGLPAEKAGLRVGDRIKRVNKKIFYSYKKLTSYLNTLEEGKEAVFKIKRGRKIKTITVLPRSEKPFIGFSCAPRRYYTTNERLKQTIAYLKGEKYKVSIMKPTIWLNGILSATLEVRNLSDKEITFDPSQIRALAKGMPLKMLSPMETASRIQKEQFEAEIAARPMQRRKTLKAKMKAREKSYFNLLKQSIKRTIIRPQETTRGLITFDDPLRISEIEIAVKVGDETFKARFNEFMKYRPKRKQKTMFNLSSE